MASNITLIPVNVTGLFSNITQPEQFVCNWNSVYASVGWFLVLIVVWLVAFKNIKDNTASISFAGFIPSLILTVIAIFGHLITITDCAKIISSSQVVIFFTLTLITGALMYIEGRN